MRVPAGDPLSPARPHQRPELSKVFCVRPLVFILSVALATPVLAQQRGPNAWDRADSAIVRLAPSAFPQLPPPVRVALTSRGCRIPQSPEVPSPHNVVPGHFRSRHDLDWAALCSRAHVSCVLIFWAGDTTRVDSLSADADRAFLQGMGGDTIAFSRVIGIADSGYIRRHAAMYDGPLPPRPWHDGINDAFAGKGSTVWYWAAGRWLRLAGAD